MEEINSTPNSLVDWEIGRFLGIIFDESILDNYFIISRGPGTFCDFIQCIWHTVPNNTGSSTIKKQAPAGLFFVLFKLIFPVVAFSSPTPYQGRRTLSATFWWTLLQQPNHRKRQPIVINLKKKISHLDYGYCVHR